MMKAIILEYVVGIVCSLLSTNYTALVITFLDVCLCLEDLINPLFYDTHIDHHVELSNPLGTKKLNVWLSITIKQIENLLETGFDLFQTTLGMIEIYWILLGLGFYLS